MTEKEVLLAEDTLNKRLEQTELALVLAKCCLAREQELIDLAVKRWGNLPVLERKNIPYRSGLSTFRSLPKTTTTFACLTMGVNPHILCKLVGVHDS